MSVGEVKRIIFCFYSVFYYLFTGHYWHIGHFYSTWMWLYDAITCKKWINQGQQSYDEWMNLPLVSVHLEKTLTHT